MSNAVVTDWPSGSANTGWPQEPTGMLMPGRVQGWPAGTQRAANAAERLLSQAVAWWDVEQYRDGDRFLRNRGTAGELLNLRLGSSIVANSNDPLYLAPEDRGYVYLPGDPNRLSVPSAGTSWPTTDWDVRAEVALDSWAPSAINWILGKHDNSTQRSFYFRVLTDGTLNFVWNVSGIGNVGATSSTPTGFAAGSRKWIRATLDIDNGAGAYEVKFFVSDDGTTWTQLGNTVTGGSTTSVTSSTTVFYVGHAYGTAGMSGKVYRAIVKDGIDGTTVLDIDCDAITSGSATSFTAVTNQTVTINRSTTGRKSVCVPSRSKGGKPVMLLGTDDFLGIPDENGWQHGLLNFDQGQSFTILIAFRQFGSAANFGVVMSKNQTAASDSPGWRLRNSGTGLTIDTLLYDGNGILNVPTTAVTSGGISVFALRLDRAGQQATTVFGGTSNAATSSKSFGSLWNQVPLYVGRGGGGVYQYLEFYAAAIWRRALSAAEITTLSNYFTGRIA